MRSLLFLSLSVLLVSCSKSKTGFDYYVISEHQYKPEPISDSLPPPPPPPPPPAQLAWYSNVVLIFDTIDVVYLYQTEWYFVKDKYRYNEDARFPRFIGLTPDHMITLNAHYLNQFLLDNDDFFMFEPVNNKFTRIVYLVSVCDTIKNQAFYEFLDLNKEGHKNGSLLTMIRETTEEERNVLSSKKSRTKYHPNEHLWSNNFIDGRTHPLSSRYDSLINESCFVLKAREMFRSDLTKLNMSIE